MIAVQEKQRVYAVHTIGLHPGEHADEYAARFLLQETPYGEQFFPGVSEAKIKYVETDIFEEGAAKKLLRQGTLLIGRGGGPFDDHAPGNEEESCTSLVAKYLGISQHPSYKKLIEEITAADNGKVKAFHIANEIKRRNRSGYTPGEVCEFAFECFRNFIREQESDNTENKGVSPTFLVKRFLASLGDYDPDYKRLLWEAEKTGPLMLSNEIRRRNRSGYTPEEVRKFAFECFRNFIWEQDIFKEAKSTCLRAMKWMTAAHHDEDIKIIFVHDDGNLMLPKAARHLGVQILIKRTSKGHVKIFSSSNDINMGLVTAALRCAESGKNVLKLPEEQLMHYIEGGKIREDEHWFYHKDGNNVFNGTETTLGVPPTKLSPSKILEIVKEYAA